MRLSFAWLNDYLQLKDTEKIRSFVDRLNETLTEVDGVEEMTPPFKQVYVGKILSIEDHPNSDRLHIAQVTIGQSKTLQIVCGANNLYKDMIVPVTLPGSVLYDEEGNAFEIQQTKIRDVLSEGMLCSEKELHVGRDHTGIVDLSFSKGLEVGDLLDPYFTDTILKIENKAITHRPDCFSHYGVAMELAAISSGEPTSYVHIPQSALLFEEVKGNKPDQKLLENKEFAAENDLSVHITGYTRRYSTITIKGVKIRNSPVELQSRILAAGHRPINNIVDLTNFVMFDIGQPLHAFDLDYTGKTFDIRTGKKGETLTALDGKTYALTEEDITITDGNKPLDFGGIIGGLESAIQPTTKNIVLVSDNFDPSMLRKTSWRHGIRTDAVTIYEKNIDTNLTIPGIVEFVSLYKKYFPEDEIEVSQILDYYPDPVALEKHIEISWEDINNLIGINISKEDIRKILKSINITILSEKEGLFTLQIPSRRVDLKIKEDVIEEIVRLYGYNRLSPRPYYYRLHEVTMYPGRNEIIRAKTYLADQGFYEIEPYSFGNSEEEESLDIVTPKVQIKNALNSVDNIAKSSILPELIKAVSLNEKLVDSFRLQIFTRTFTETEKGKLPIEEKHIGGVAFEKTHSEEKISDLFYQTKAIIIGLFQMLRIPPEDISFTMAGSVNEKIFLKDQALDISCRGKIIGTLGVSSEYICSRYDIAHPFIIFDMLWSPLLDATEQSFTLKPYSKQPNITTDISMYIGKGTHIGEIISHIRESKLRYLTQVQTLDLYRENGKTSITIRLTFNDPKKTLTGDIVGKQIEVMQEMLHEKLGSEITFR